MFRRVLSGGVMLAAVGGLNRDAQAAPADFIWLEGEQPTGVNIQVKEENTGHPEFLSERKWFKVTIDADKLEKNVPEGGVLIRYAFQSKQAGDYEIWNRAGYEFVRSPFDWRLDSGEWAGVSPEELTTDLMELSFFTEVAWLKLGRKSLRAGEHTLEIRLPKTTDAKGKPQRILYASDALCLVAGEFHPNGKFKPGQDGREAKDLQAAKTLFTLPEGKSGNQSVKLAGLWEVCRHDEQMPREVAEAIKDFPAEPHWRGIEVPGDKNKSRPDLVFAHRLCYRTKLNVPASYAGQSFYLDFPQNNLNTTVWVNGQFCGFNKNPFAHFQIDVTKGIKPGVNEVWVGIKDAWYGYSANPEKPLKLRQKFNLPVKFFGDGFQDLAYPIWNHPQSGILVTPTLVAAGPVYVADVFVMPQVQLKRLAVKLRIVGPSPAPLSGELLGEAVNDATGEVEKRFAPKALTIAANSEAVFGLDEPWENPKLWWPDEPNLYRLRATLRVAGKTVDARETTFGFREWGSRGKDFTLNGIPWHFWADTFTANTKEEWLKLYKEKNQTTMRFWGVNWKDLPPEESLDFFDRGGVAVRRSGILDGEAIGYNAVEHDPGLKKLYGSEIKMDLMKNWLDQVVAQVKGERNHPSVQLWSIENEWLYINCINLHGGLMDPFEAEVRKCSDAVRAVDPTRLTMTDGGGANKDNSMPVHGNHYVFGGMTKYPDLAYESNPTGGGRGRWVWDEQRPRFVGEDFFMEGYHPEFASLGGEQVFTGKAGSLPAVGLAARILTEGYRWAGFGGFHFWMTQGATDQSYYRSFAPRAVFCREWDWTFGSGEKIQRTLRIFNDTHDRDEMAYRGQLKIKGSDGAAGGGPVHALPGASVLYNQTLEMPLVLTRTEGEFVMSLAVKGKEVFKDVKPVSIIPRPSPHSKLIAKELLVFDPQGSASAWLKTHGVAFTPLAGLTTLPEAGKVLLIGKDALDAVQSTASALAAYASAGRRIIVLEQKNPLRYQGLPCEMEAAENEGGVAFGEDLEHPALRGLQQQDFFTWPGNSVVYRKAYAKPARGAKSLVQCDERLQNSALVEVPTGSGLLLLSQLLIGEKLEQSAVARQLLANLIDYAASYRLEFQPVVSVTKGDAPLAKVLDLIGLSHTEASDPLAALAGSEKHTAIIAATPENLKTLAANLGKVGQFTSSGGWIILHGLTPGGLSDYNRIVGVEHLIRPFRRERVTFAPVKNHLTAGLSSGDVALYSSERIFPWQDGNYVAGDTYSYVVDYDEVAPFAKFPDDFALNVANGFVSADAWKYIWNVPAPATPPLDLKLTFPKEQELVEMEWIGNTFYFPVTRVQLFFEGHAAGAMTFETKPNNEPQTFAIHPPLKGTALTVRLADWEKPPGKSAVTGLDNLRLKAKRSPEFYAKVKPMLNNGALVEYPQGAGGIVLCNVLFQEAESPPANAMHKQNILATILRNLKAPFVGGQTLIAGANLRYEPIDLSKHATAFRDEKGWYGDKKFTFAALPTGQQKFAGVTYEIYDFPTSPVPTALMLGGNNSKLATEIRGISVNRKADALFFLQTAHLDQRMTDDERKKKKQFEMLRYIVHYADGKQVEIPIHAEIDIDNYQQKGLAAIPGAQIAWAQPYEGTEYMAVAYSKQWNNPRRDVEITSVDMVYGKDKRGVPTLLALTAASAE